MKDPKCDEEHPERGNHSQLGSSAVNKAVVKEALTELLSEIPGLKNLFSNSPGTMEAAAQQASKDTDKQGVVKSKL